MYDLEGLIMAKATVEIPDEKFAELGKYKDRWGELLLLGLTQMKIEEALVLYQKGVISFGRSADLAGLSQHDMMRQARARGIEPRWSEAMVEEELV
jgi:predicted HTH domain antitoxin